MALNVGGAPLNALAVDQRPNSDPKFAPLWLLPIPSYITFGLEGAIAMSIRPTLAISTRPSERFLGMARTESTGPLTPAPRGLWPIVLGLAVMAAESPMGC